MFFYSVCSKKKVVHYEGCHHLRNIKADNLKSFASIREVRKSDRRLCSCCSPITKHLNRERAALEKYCAENGLLYFVHNGNLHIRTVRSKWKILASDDKNVLELHHKNSYEKEHENSVPGYHKQNFFSDSVLGYLEYISEHEYYRMLNPLQVFTKKEPPKKGTRRYKNRQKALAKKERRRQIWNVNNLIDSLSGGTHCATRA